jgi:hypothetical protein
LILDIVAADIDNDGTTEIILNRTIDSGTNWYNGFQLNVYKTTDNYKTFRETNIITYETNSKTWMYKLNLYQKDNVYYLDGIIANGKVYRWKYNLITNRFE